MFETMNLAIFIGSALVVASVFTSLISFRFGAPLLLIFLTVGLLAGEDGPLGIEFDNGRAAFFVGSVALADHPVRFRLRDAERDASRRRLAGGHPRHDRRADHGGAGRGRREGDLRPPLDVRPDPRRRGRADRRGGRLLPAPGRRHQRPRPRPLDARGRIRNRTTRSRSSSPSRWSSLRSRRAVARPSTS